MSNVQENQELSQRMSTEKKEAIRLQTLDYFQKKAISQKKLAAQIPGISEATLSHILSGKWDSIDDGMWLKLSSHINSRMQVDLFTTADFNCLSKAMTLAKESCLMVGITADTGMGKTSAMKAFALRRNVFYVVVEKSMKPKQFFASLLHEMGISYDATIYEMVNRIATELTSLEKPLLLIDEAGKLSHTLMLYLHDLRNKTAHNAGILLAGMPYFKTNLEKMAGRQKEGCAEFLRRINLWDSLKGLHRKEIIAICESNGITEKEVLQDMCLKRRFADLHNAILFHNLSNATDEAANN